MTALVETLVTLTDNIRRQLDQGVLTLLFLLDLTAAFNMVSYRLLIYFLDDIEICGVTFQWLTLFLHRWGQTVVLGERMSMRHLLGCKMLQGAIPSPTYICAPCQAGIEFLAGVPSVYCWHPTLSVGGWPTRFHTYKPGQVIGGYGGMAKAELAVAESQ